MKLNALPKSAVAVVAILLIGGCGTVPLKQFYMLNYLPSASGARINSAPYPITLRLREFDIEEAYNRPQIVYRQSPFQLEYYYYQVWAVKPARMVSDLVYKHLLTANLFSSVIRRFDEGPKPDFELSGIIEALDEYDSGELWFAHLALRFTLTRVSDGTALYTRRYDLRKRVYQHTPENVIREMSALMEFIMNQTMQDLDARLSRELNIGAAKGGAARMPVVKDSTGTIEEIQ